jgi:hypothetical protein
MQESNGWFYYLGMDELRINPDNLSLFELIPEVMLS